MPANRYNAFWRRRTRPAILYRDRRQCQIRGPGCTGYATTVDHVKPLVEGGAMHDPANLRAACWTCNCARGAATLHARQGWRQPPKPGQRRIWPGAIDP